MRPNLSLESIAGALAVLGTGVIMGACGGESEPAKTPLVNATEVSGATDKAPAPATPAVEKPVDPVTAAKPADMPAPATSPAPATPADAKAITDTKPATGSPATPGTAKKPAATPAAAKKGGSGSCGAGTCSAKK